MYDRLEVDLMLLPSNGGDRGNRVQRFRRGGSQCCLAPELTNPPLTRRCFTFGNRFGVGLLRGGEGLFTQPEKSTFHTL